MIRRPMGLDGEWSFMLDPEDRHAGTLPDAAQFRARIRVPGSWEEQGFGEAPPSGQIDTWTKTREYVGAAWYRTEFVTDAAEGEPADWRLTLTGVRWTSEVWVNGHYAGLQDSLSAPHVHELENGWIQHGRNELLIRIDNRMRLPLADSHIHTRHTATEWGGITGGVLLEALPRLRIEKLNVTPDVGAGAFHCRAILGGSDARSLADHTVAARFRAPDGQVWEAAAACEAETVEWTCSLGNNPALWSDQHPQLYDAEFVLLRDGVEVDRLSRRVGLRQLQASGKRLLLNGQPVFLRGYVDCCIFPLTGYPVWDQAHYERQFRIAKSYGFNHVRLHGWNAPEPFWAAADEAGMLVQTELPHWSTHYQPRGAQPPEDVDAFLEAELFRIYESLNAHPSFVMFSMGNELIEDDGHERLNEWVRLARQLDPSRIVTDNTGFGQLPEQDREGDFFIHSFNWHKPLRTEEIAIPATNRDFSALTRLTDKPVVGHEHAQFAMYVRPQEREKYTGVLQPTWLDSIEETLQRKGLADRVDEFIDASGRHLARSLKESMERIRRTPDAAGVQLLDIRDFPGQGHATTGLLDVFWDSKGLLDAEPALDAERALDFNGPTVALMSCEQRTWFAGETLQARLLISHYGEESMLNGRLNWRLRSGDENVAEGAFPVDGIARGSVEEVGTVRWRVPDAEARALILEVWWVDAQRLPDAGGTNHIGSIRNEWSFWTFPQVRTYEQASSVWSSAPVLKTALYGATIEQNSRFDPRTYPQERGVKLVIVERLTTNVLQYLTGGGSVWMLAGESELYDVVMTKYLPVFWNYLMFSEQAGGTMGTIVHPHPALGNFPHDGYSDWQWNDLFNGSPAICLDAVPEVAPIIEPIDNFNRAKRLAYMFEARVGKGRLFATSLAFRQPDDWKRPEVAYLFRELLRYLHSDDFRPAAAMTVGQVLSLFRLRGIHTFM